MLGWSHRLKFWTILGNQILALFLYVGQTASIFGGGEVNIFIVIYVGIVLLVTVLSTFARGY